jgi:hypothetical protein
LLVYLSPNGFCSLPAIRQAVPAPISGPDGLCGVIIGFHHLAQQNDAAEVKGADINCSIVRAGIEAVRFGSDDIEGAGGSSFVQFFEVERVGQILGAGFFGWGQGRGDDGSVGIGGADGLGCGR